MTPVIRARCQPAYSPRMATSEPLPASVVPGHDVLSLVAARGGRCMVAELKAAAERTFGPEAVFGNCHGDLFDFGQLLAFFERKGKIAVAGDEVRLGAGPACSGH
jgi:probable metal-binding protein